MSGCKGEDAWGQTALPEGRFTSVSSGWRHTCRVKEDGTVACWGSEDAQDLSTPPEVPFTSVSVGGTLVCGVRTGGAVVCWGAHSGSRCVSATLCDVVIDSVDLAFW